MHADNRAMLAESATDMPLKRRRRAPVIGRIDHRTKRGRRVQELITCFTNFFGGDHKVTPIMRADIHRAAELITLAESARGAALRCTTVANIEDLTRLEIQCRQSLETAGPAKGNTLPITPTLQEYLASRTEPEVIG